MIYGERVFPRNLNFDFLILNENSATSVFLAGLNPVNYETEQTELFATSGIYFSAEKEKKFKLTRFDRLENRWTTAIVLPA